jgi:hypothetical protein
MAHYNGLHSHSQPPAPRPHTHTHAVLHAAQASGSRHQATSTGKRAAARFPLFLFLPPLSSRCSLHLHPPVLADPGILLAAGCWLLQAELASLVTDWQLARPAVRTATRRARPEEPEESRKQAAARRASCETEKKTQRPRCWICCWSLGPKLGSHNAAA